MPSKKKDNQGDLLKKIKSEPKIKRLLIFAKIFNVLFIILLLAAIAFAVYKMIGLQSEGSLNADAVKDVISGMKLYVLIFLGCCIAFIILKGLLSLIADNMIDKRLTKAATERGVQNKYPTGKNVKPWKSLVRLCGIVMLLFLVSAGVTFYFINSFIAIILLICFVLSTFVLRAITKKATALETRRIDNITLSSSGGNKRQKDDYIDDDYDDDYLDDYDDSYIDDYYDSFDDGYISDYDIGYDDGYEDGYDDGFEDFY